MCGAEPLGEESLSVTSWQIDLRLGGIYFDDTHIVTNRLCVLETLLSCFLRDTSTIRTDKRRYTVSRIFERYVCNEQYGTRETASDLANIV